MAIEKLLSRHGKAELYEINEAFVVSIAYMNNLKISSEECNVFGGAVALGHHLECSGARIICTLINALIQHGKHSGIATICHGGGGATAIRVEICQKSML